MSKVVILKSDRVIQVSSDHHPDLVAKARAIGGIWTGNSWAFDISLEKEVRELYISIFGEFGKSHS